MFYPFLIKQNETNAVRRRIPVVLVQLADGWTGIAGKTLVTGEMKISKDGAAFVNVAGTVTDLASGDYYYEATQAEVDTLGTFMGRWIPASTARSSRFAVQVVAFDPYDSVSMGLTRLDATVSSRSTQASVDTLATQVSQDTQTTAINSIKAKTDQLAFTSANKVDAALQAAADFPQVAADKIWSSTARTLTAFDVTFKTGYSLSTAGVLAVWDALTSALTVVGSIGKRLVDNVDATVGSRATQTSVDSLTTTVNTKASQASVDSRASQVSVDTVSSAVALKASQTSVDSKASQSSVDTINSRITAQRATNLDNLDVAVSSRASGANLTQSDVRAAVGLAAANLDQQFASVPTAVQNADTLLKRDMAQVTGEARRSPLNAFRTFVNAWRIGGGLFTVRKENNVDEAWAADVVISGSVFEFTPHD